MNIAQGSVSFEDVTVEFTQDEWQYVGPAQRTLYKDVMLENYSHLISLGYCIIKPQVIFKLEHGEEPWSSEEEFLNQKYPGYCRVDVHIEENREKQEKPLWQVVFIDNKILSKEEQKLDIQHEKTHTGEQCYKYNENLETLSYVKDHHKFQTLEQSFECNEYGKVLHDKTVCVTAKSSVTGEDSCKDNEFRGNCDKAALFNHMRTGTRKKCFDLNECGKSCEYNEVHMALAHNECNESGNNFSRNSPLTQPQRTVTGQGAFESSKCEENLSQSSGHIVHQKIQTRDTFCVYNGFTNTFYQKLDFTVHQRTHKEEKFYQCDKYEKSFHQNSALSVHQQCDTGEKSFELTECRKSFYQKAHLIQHQRTHPGEKPYECEECGKSFCSNSHPVHYPGTHMGVNLYECNECGKTFADNSTLRAHQRIHTKEKPFKCNDCERSSAHNSALRAHQRIHTGEKPYECNDCEKTFAHNSTLRAHQKIHTGVKLYKCNECGKTFSQKTHLSTHQRIHTGVKPYGCSEYGKTFSQKSYLSGHERIHRG
ncbi:hypothetical protein J1605_018172 [Eschrichtius robustus]|uniref:Zinc finger protein 658 n=1 Tax=Eschrichtius robustus TaxID=9764 RepID=A0AB34HW39_ESCRO|nr:hypothetical protein J1605_018172 [Eschrichtius robustus]